MSYPTKRLGEISEIKLGGTPPRNDKNNFGGDFLWCSIRDMKDKYIYNTNEKLTEQGVKNSNVKLLNEGTLFMSFKLSLGKLAFAGKDLYTNEAIAGFDFYNENEIDKFFLYYILLGYDFSKSGTDNSVKGATLNKAKLEQLDIPLPPLPTQKLIVQKLDSSFEKIDKSIKLTKKNLKNIEELNKSVLEEVFSENGYKIKKLKDIVTLIMGQSPKSETYNRKGIGLPFFQGKKEFGEFNPVVEVYCSNPIKIAENGDILMSVRAPVGPTNIANQKCCIGRGLGAIRPNLDILELSYLLSYFKKFESEISSLGKGSTFSSITKSNLENLQIPLPPLQKQKEIVAQLDKVFEKNKALKESYEKKLKDLEEMKQSLLKEAFEGRLVKD